MTKPFFVADARGRVIFVMVLVLAVTVGLNVACTQRQSNSTSTPKAIEPTVVFMTDFGTADDSVAICKGVMLNIAPAVRIIDLTHQVPAFSVADAARFLYGATPYYPAGAIFVGVIDPGVGTTRKAIVAKSKRGQYFVLPDNGLITLVQERDGIEAAREITNQSWMLGDTVSSTFHGRDIFSPVAAHLARGDDWTEVGPEIKELVRLKLASASLDNRGLHGEVIALDGPFGNLVTNISAEEFRQLGYALGDKVHLRLGEQEMALPFVKTFGDVPQGKALLFIDSRGRLSMAINRGNFAETYNSKPPISLFIPRR